MEFNGRGFSAFRGDAGHLREDLTEALDLRIGTKVFQCLFPCGIFVNSRIGEKCGCYLCGIAGIILFASYDQVLFDSFKVAWPFDKIRIRGALKGYCDMLQDPFRVIEVDCYIDDIFWYRSSVSL